MILQKTNQFVTFLGKDGMIYMVSKENHLVTLERIERDTRRKQEETKE